MLSTSFCGKNPYLLHTPLKYMLPCISLQVLLLPDWNPIQQHHLSAHHGADERDSMRGFQLAADTGGCGSWNQSDGAYASPGWRVGLPVHGHSCRDSRTPSLRRLPPHPAVPDARHPVFQHQPLESARGQWGLVGQVGGQRKVVIGPRSRPRNRGRGG